MAEKRKQVRKIPQFFVGVYDNDQTKSVGRVANISSGGLMVIGKYELTRYANYKISMDLPYAIKEKSQVFFEAQCRWCERGGRTKLYSSGLEITNISSENSEILAEFLEDPQIVDESGVSNISVIIEADA
ncbi:MAG: PilZ domain-containing protein [candidate division Zixibacteria bacterium]|nr:PilZ domain-containing protein [candidate division Zixibacteria bacterium]